MGSTSCCGAREGKDKGIENFVEIEPEIRVLTEEKLKPEDYMKDVLVPSSSFTELTLD